MPFSGSDEKAILKAILAEVPVFIHRLNDAQQFFISELLQKNPQKRIGSNTSDIREHSFFRFDKRINEDITLIINYKVIIIQGTLVIRPDTKSP